MAYVQGDTEEEAQHAGYCDMMLNGPLVDIATDLSVIWRDGAHWISHVTDDSPKEQRKLAHDLSRVANREMQYDGGIYHYSDPPDARVIQIFVYVVDCRANGLLLLERRKTVFGCTWPMHEGEMPSCIEHPEIPWMWSVGIIWLHPSLRGRGIAQRFLGQSLVHMGKSLEEIGWYTPFSQQGEALVRRLCPLGFFVAK